MISDTETFPTASPSDFDGPRVRLYCEEFVADPHKFYREMRRRFGSLAPVELAPGVPATLVIGYHAALQILHDPERFPPDPRVREGEIAANCPIRSMMAWRLNPLRSAGEDHTRHRSAAASALGKVDLHRLHTIIEQIAIRQINSFREDGHCDVVSQYALPVVFGTLNALLGSPSVISQRAAIGMAAIFDTVDADRGNQMLSEALVELTRFKRIHPGADVTSWLIEHPVGLDDDEMLHQLSMLYAAGIEPPLNLIANTMLLLLTDERFAGEVLGRSRSTRDALDEVLFNDPPMSNYYISYPRQPVFLNGSWLPAHQPVLISMAACNNDPAIRTGDVTDKRSHLAFSTGPHACPARSAAELIVQDAIDQLLDALPEIKLAVPASQLHWRRGPFHQALSSLPVIFPKSPPIRSGGNP
ncbi:cytochrome P450 [Nocardia abscessus]|uniref:cytochrome P450 n=1 Tax=Nocardia abscessus TaxID=120957 RepID=UPI001895B7DF|nr:cytochrome P450 [Nocardia abscessus]MBF6338831.1 cytochrome P450 [Nocardia abscessus]